MIRQLRLILALEWVPPAAAVVVALRSLADLGAVPVARGRGLQLVLEVGEHAVRFPGRLLVEQRRRIGALPVAIRGDLRGEYRWLPECIQFDIPVALDGERAAVDRSNISRTRRCCPLQRFLDRL